MQAHTVFGDHKAFLGELKKGVPVCTTREMYDHFLNVLPPARMGADWFMFRESDESIHFWKQGGQCFARYGRVMVANTDYSRWVVVRAPSRDSLYEVVDSFNVDDVMGRKFHDIEDVAKTLDLLM